MSLALSGGFNVLSVSSAPPGGLPLDPQGPRAQGPRQVEVLIENAGSPKILNDIADLIVAYMAPSKDELRDDFSKHGQLSEQTKTALDLTGRYIQHVDLSGIVLGKPNRACDEGRRSNHRCLDDNDVSRCLSLANPQIFTDLFSRCRNIRVLNLTGCNINDACVATIRPHLQLQTLNLSGNRALSWVAMRDIAQMTTLQHLSLRNMVQDDEDDATNLCFYSKSEDDDDALCNQTKGIRFLNALPALRTLDLSQNYFGDGVDWLDTDIELVSLVPDILVMMQRIQTLTAVMLNDCPELTAAEVDGLRQGRPRATVEVISNAS